MKVILLLSNIINVLIFFYFCRKTIDDGIKRLKWLQNMLIIVLFILKIYFLCMHHSAIINLIIAMLLYSSILQLYKCSVQKKILLLFLYMSFSILSEEIGMQIMEKLYGTYVEVGVIQLIVFSLFCHLSLLIIVIITSTILNSVEKENMSTKDTVYLLFYPAATIYYVIISRYPIYFKGIDISFYSTLLLFILANILTTKEISRNMKNSKLRMENEILIQKHKSDLEYYNLLVKKNEKEKSLLHDINKHESYLMELLKNGDNDSAKEYLGNLLSNQKNDRIILTKNKTLDLILNMKNEEIRKNKIELDLVDIEAIQLNIPEVDQCTIFANLIENAIENCSECIKPYIKITFRYLDENKIVFKIENNYIELEENLKKNGEYHGYGLKNVEECVEKNKGLMRIINQNEIFTVIIAFRK